MSRSVSLSSATPATTPPSLKAASGPTDWTVPLWTGSRGSAEPRSVASVCVYNGGGVEVVKRSLQYHPDLLSIYESTLY